VLAACWLGGCTTDNGETDPVAGEPAAADPGSRPNLLLIVADDMAYTDLGAFGGEIATPNLDALAARGVKLTNFHAAPTCAPTRSMLLTGADNHTAGLGSMFGPNMLRGIEGRAGYEGFLNPQIATLPEILADAGYHTYMAGKWHLGSAPEQWPSARGFERSFALLPGSGDHFTPRPGDYEVDGAAVEVMPPDFYSTRSFTDTLIANIAEDLDDGRPFFAYAAYTSPHWPLQAPDAFIDRYAGRYDDGFDAVREERLRRARSLGVIPAAGAPLPEWLGASWDDLSAEQRAGYARKMEIYAAMVENLDYHVGRLLAFLDDVGELDNTVILFMSDNGAESDEMELNPTFAGLIRRQGNDNSLANLGRRGSWASYGAGWAQAGMAPFRNFKGFTTEGGTRVPAFLAWGTGTAAARIDTQYLRAADVAPTFIELAAATALDGRVGDRRVTAIEGRSFARLLRDDTAPVYAPADAIAAELHGHRSIQRGSYKLVWEQEPGNTWWGYPIPPQWRQWRLYRVDVDPGETRDLSDQEPETAAELARLWENYADDHGVARDVGVIGFERWHPAAEGSE